MPQKILIKLAVLSCLVSACQEFTGRRERKRIMYISQISYLTRSLWKKKVVIVIYTFGPRRRRIICCPVSTYGRVKHRKATCKR